VINISDIHKKVFLGQIILFKYVIIKFPLLKCVYYKINTKMEEFTPKLKYKGFYQCLACDLNLSLPKNQWHRKSNK